MPRPVPMKLRMLADCGSTGAALTSTFHQLSAGKSCGSGAPGCAMAPLASASARLSPPSAALLEVAIDVDQYVDAREGAQELERAAAGRRQRHDDVVRARRAGTEAHHADVGRCLH